MYIEIKDMPMIFILSQLYIFPSHPYWWLINVLHSMEIVYHIEPEQMFVADTKKWCWLQYWCHNNYCDTLKLSIFQ